MWKTVIANVDESEISSLYDKAHLAVRMVQEYDPTLLENISTIANLSGGAYGVYNNADNQKIIPEDIKEKLRYIYQGNITDQQMAMIPKAEIVAYFDKYKEVFPDVDVQALQDQIQQDDTIRVNVNRILQESSSDEEAIIEIASTIVHEATHEIEKEETGQTSEAGPEAAERDFINAVAAGTIGAGVLQQLRQINQQYQQDEIEDGNIPVNVNLQAEKWVSVFKKG